MTDTRIPLQQFISREFFKAALFPLLIIEITLIGLYFFMNNYLIDKSIKTLTDDRFAHLLGITETQTRIISEQLHNISNLSYVLKAETTRFFSHPDHFSVPNPIPEFRVASNGVYYKTQNNGGCSLFYSALEPINAEKKTKALKSEALDPLYRELSEANSNIVAVYLNTFDSMSRYYPFCENVHEQLPPQMDIPNYNFYYLGDATHNPDRESVWTAAYLDPMGMGWMMSCVVPIYNNDFLEGVAGIDITIKSFIDNLLGLQLPWKAHAFLVDGEGTIMAMPPAVENIFGLTELHEFEYQDKVAQDTEKPKTFNLLESVLSTVREPVTNLMQEKSGIVPLSLNGHRYILCQNTVSETGWKLMMIADQAVILSPIATLELNAQRVGYAAIGFMVIFYILFFLYLVRNTRFMSERIAETIGGLSHAIQRVGTGAYEADIKPSPVTELNILSSNFESMVRDLKLLHSNLDREVKHANEAKTLARTAEEKLRENQATLEKTVEDRTLELKRTNEKLEKDIARRKQIEEELNVERRQLLSIFDSIDEPVYVSAPDTYELLYVNEALKKYWSDAPRGKCYEVLQGRNSPCPFCTNDIIFGEKLGQPHIWEFYNNVANRWFRCVDKAIQWPDGRLVRYEMAIDITEQKTAAHEKQRLTNRLQRAEKMEALGTLAGGVAHDLNNILSGIVSYPDLLLMDMPPESPFKKPITIIQKSGQKAAAIVQDLLTLARRGVAIMEPTNLNDTVTEYLASPEHVQLLSHHPDILLKTDCSDDLLYCKGSAIHLLKMVMNLVSNAAEAMPNGGEITISTYNQYIDRPLKGYDEVLEGDYTVLRVSDCGIGISEEDMERIFEPFYTKKKMGRSGTGLGMAVVWGTVKDHHGYIEVKSILGKNTVFEIYLPATRETLVKKDSDALALIKGNKETILVVDDVGAQREIAVEMLTRLGYKAFALPSGEEAIAYLEKNTVDLILLDMIMEPNINGLETYRRIIKIHPGQKAIIVSGYSETEDIREAQRLGAARYVKKPYTIYKIGPIIREELQK